jgi:UDP-glucuronate 4-epimerase
MRYCGAMDVLVTGAAGFIGSHLCERLIGRGDRVIGFDNFDPFYPRSVKERNLAGLRRHRAFRFFEGDLTDPNDISAALDAAGRVDGAVHLAALPGVHSSIKNQLRTWAVNLTGTMHLFSIGRGRGIDRFIFASSSSVYGRESQIPFNEREPCGRPLSPYAASKRSGELLAFNEHHLYGSSITCLRLFTAYGPRQRPDLAIHKFTRLIADDQPVELFGQDSSRDYTWIDDIIDGVIAAIDQQAKAANPSYRIYNLGGARPTGLKSVVDRIAGALGKNARITWQPELPGDTPHTLADIELAQRELGYQPKISIDQGIPRFVAWWRAENGR